MHPSPAHPVPLESALDADLATGAASPARLPSLRATVAALSLSMLLSSLGISIASVGLPAIAADLGASFQAVQWVVVAYLLAVTATTVAAGRLGDLIGRRRVLMWGVGLFSVASAAAAFAPTVGLLVAARAVQGLGAAAMMALTLAMVGDVVPAARAGAAMGWLGTTSAIGTALGPAAGGLLLAAFGWQALFLAKLPLGLATLALLHRHLPPDGPVRRIDAARLDLRGTLVLALVLGTYALAMTPDGGRPGLREAALLAGAVLGLGVFVRLEASAPAPLVRGAWLRDGPLGGALAMSTLVSVVMMTTLVVGPFHLAGPLGLDAARAGLVLAIGPAVAALCGTPAGWLVDRFGAGRITRVGLVGMGAGALLLGTLPVSLGVPAYAGPLALLTAGYALFQTANNAGTLRDLPAAHRGVVSGLLGLSRNLGFITGAALMGGLYAAAGSATPVVGPDEGGALRITFAVAAVLVGLALGIALRPRH